MERDIIIYKTESVKDAIKKLDKSAKKVLLVTNSKDRLLGTITDGDIRRYILSGKNLENDIEEVYNKDPIYIKKGDFSIDSVRKILIKNKIELIPILDEENTVIEFITWDQLFSDGQVEPVKTSKINIPVILMAGGRGERLEPFTKIFPKPLIPLGDKPVIEIILDKFRRHGVDNFYIILNYKGGMIESYLNSSNKRPYKIKYVWEKEFLGTAGGLKLIPSIPNKSFIVSNSDIIVDIDYSDLVNFHNKNNYILTVVGSMQYHKIPYGVINFGKDGKIDRIQEKPEFNITINTGVYVLSKKALDFIPKNKYYDMTDLMQLLLKKNESIGVYPASEKSYIDIGQWEEYKKAIEKIKFLK